jgi:glycosyltransferase involved in cell wall biosynthesis
MSPLVSIITASLNAAGHLEKAIASVAAQSYPRIEHIVVDGGSSDGTVEMLRKYDGRIEWTSEPDRGQSDAINKGFSRARGEILGWLDADNVYEPRAVAEAVELLETRPDAGVVYGGVLDVDISGRIVREYMPPEFTLERFLLYHEFNFMPPSSTFIRRDVLERAGLLDVSLHYTMDFDLWLRMALTTNFVRCESFWSRFLLRDESKTGSQMARFGWDILKVTETFLARNDLAEGIRRKESSIRARMLEHAADRIITSDFEKGRKYYAMALREAPLSASMKLMRTVAYLYYRDSFVGKTYRGMKRMVSSH